MGTIRYDHVLTVTVRELLQQPASSRLVCGPLLLVGQMWQPSCWTPIGAHKCYDTTHPFADKSRPERNLQLASGYSLTIQGLWIPLYALTIFHQSRALVYQQSRNPKSMKVVFAAGLSYFVPQENIPLFRTSGKYHSQAGSTSWW